MKFKHKIKIDLKEFISTGKFDYLKIGMNRQEVLNVFPEPEEWAVADTFKKSSIWRYGNFELHFHNDQLWMIYNDYIHSIDGGKFLDVDKWVIGKKRSKTLLKFIEVLLAEKIDFEKTTSNFGQIILKGINTGVKILFEPINEDETTIPKEFIMTSICKM